MVAAATALLSRLTPAEREAACFPLHVPTAALAEHRAALEADGIRLDQADATLRDAIMAVVRASLSSQGFDKTRNVMKLDRFLGDLVDGPGVMANGASLSVCSPRRR